MTGAELIARERERQVSEEGWTAEHDDSHELSELATAAACYALPPRKRQCNTIEHFFGVDEFMGRRGGARSVTYRVPKLWPWDYQWWKPEGAEGASRIKELVKAGALIAAEIDRLQRGERKQKKTKKRRAS